MCYQFGWQMTDKENLLAIGCLILAIAFNGVLLLLNFWSVAAHEFFAYRTIGPNMIDKCSHVKAIVNNKK
jgi:hypothetical protein